MKNKRLTIAILILFILGLLNITSISAQEPVGNRVSAQLSHLDSYFTYEDSIENVSIVWDHHWGTNIINRPDGGPPVLNPKVQLQTDLNLVRFYPDDPSIFTAQPEVGLYTWNFEGLQIEEPAMLPLRAYETQDTLIARPRFAASRTIEPEILTEDITFQTITVNFRLEEPLPLEVNWIMISIGSEVIAYEEYRLVEGRFISQLPVEDWTTGTDGVQAWWVSNPLNVEVGKTYTFQATLEIVKSADLLGSPIYKPTVRIQYGQWFNEPFIVTASSVTITDPNNIISATFSADNVVDWDLAFSDPHFNFWFSTILSQITPPPPPFHVLIPADVKIKPETLNLRSKGVITAFVELPEQYSIEDIDISTIECQGAPVIKAIINKDTLILKFRRQDLQDIKPGDAVELLVTGQLIDGSIFEGSDVVRVIE